MTDAVQAFISAWQSLHELPVPSMDPVATARWHNERRQAAAHVAAVGACLPYPIVKLTDYFDWDRCRVNVYALVAPGLVKWQ